MAPKYNRKKSAKHSSNSSKGGSKTRYIIIGVVAIVVAVMVIAYFAGAFNSNTLPAAVTPSAQTISPTTSPVVAPTQTPATNNTKVLLQTSMGDITIELFDYKPVTTTNFLNLVAAGKYDGTVFHRIMENFMIQGGSINENLTPINDEIGSYNHNYKYTIAMAKTSAPNSATSGFFINTVDNSIIESSNGSKFDDTYTAFGIVIEGQDVVDAIAKVPVTTNSAGEKSQPTQTVTLISATIIT